MVLEHNTVRSGAAPSSLLSAAPSSLLSATPPRAHSPQASPLSYCPCALRRERS